MHNVGGVRYARLSAVNNCAMVKKVKVTNGIQEPWTEEDSLELRQVLSACRGGGTPQLSSWPWDSKLHVKGAVSGHFK